MLVTLVNLSVGAGSELSRPVPLGVLYLAANLQKCGIAVEIRNYEHNLDREPYSAKAFARFLAGSGKLVAISLLSNMMPILLAGIPLFKRENPACSVVVGGFGASANPDLLLQTCPDVDYVISGWGEKSLCDLVAALEGHSALESIAGLSFRLNNNERVHVPPAQLCDVDQLPNAAHQLVGMRDRHTSIPIITARGCPHRCAFCDIPGHNNYRPVYRDLDRVLDEICELHSLYRQDALARQKESPGVPQVDAPELRILDDTFCTQKERVRMFCEKLSKRGLGLKWAVCARVDEVTPDLLDQMAAAGCEGILFGIESGSDRVLKAFGKGFDSNRAINTIEFAAQRIKNVIPSFVWGVPMETREDFNETLSTMAMCKMFGAQPQFLFWSPMPRSRLFREYRKKLVYSRRFLSDLVLKDETFLNDYDTIIRANPELCSCFYHYPHEDLDERAAQVRKFVN